MTCKLPPAFNSSSPWTADFTVNVTGTDMALAWDKGPKTGPVPILAGTQKATATTKVPANGQAHRASVERRAGSVFTRPC